MLMFIYITVKKMAAMVVGSLSKYAKYTKAPSSK